MKIALGTDAAVYPHGLNAHELDVYVNQIGMAPLAALQSGDHQRRGPDGLDAPRRARWSRANGPISLPSRRIPLDDVRVLQDVKFVMKGGLVYKGEGLQP